MARYVGDCFIFSYCPLSNNFPTPFSHQNVNYVSGLHMYQAEKALHFRDYEKWHDIVSCRGSPSELRNLSSTIQNFDINHWSEVAAKVMEKVTTIKMDNNREASYYLQHTGNYKLLYASENSPFWSTGLNLLSDKNVNASNWKGNNVLGKLLEEYRKRHKYSCNVNIYSNVDGANNV